MTPLLALTVSNDERRQTRCDLLLHVDRAGLDPLKGYRGNPLNHAALIAQSKVAELGGKGDYVFDKPRSKA